MTIPDRDLLHVVPEGDLREHVTVGLRCWCHPEECEDDPYVIVHHSADGRELYETGQRKLN